MVPSVARANSPALPDNQYPWVHWHALRDIVDEMWDPENAPHHALISLTGGGKSFLARHGLLDMCQSDRVLIVDTKNNSNDIVSQMGRPVSRFPKRAWYQGMGRRRNEPMRDWFRLVAPDPDGTTGPVNVVYEALESAYQEGDWVIYLDETWDITNRNRRIGYDCEGVLSKIWRKGRSRHVSVVAATQAPVAVPRLFYDQASFAWIGRIRDEDRQKRLLEIGGLSKRDLAAVSSLKRRQWLLAADNGEFFARTVVRKRG